MAFIIVVPAADLPRDPTQLSYQFVLLPTKTFVKLRDLYSRDLWIVLYNNGKSYLWCKLHIIAVEELLDGASLQCYLLSGDLERSEYFIRPLERPKSLRVDGITWFDAEVLQQLTRISRTQEEELHKLARDFVPVKMIKPDTAIVDVLWRPSGKNIAIEWLKSIVRQLKLKYTISELYRYHESPGHWSPYESFAFSYLEQKFPVETRSLVFPKESATESMGKEYVRSVDIIMREVEPDKVKVRKYINPPEAEIDYAGLDAYLKTERADIVHQAILRELAKRTILLGKIPWESNSVDLFIESAKNSIIVEVKSADELSFYRQCMKGAMQLLEYSYCMKTQRNTDCRLLLVVQNIQNERLKTYLSGLLSQISISLLGYDGTRDWPKRVLGFDDLIRKI